ncbi:MAG: UDP-N-acetylmuramoyl-L-alanyl-D-glutamate--2,6-diaminopimelate ligase [Endomicrobiales bacterium]|nr:UDP-N-acetylmuramoyl-L-alanyl-D-glutamate--2,6-diaminopimelate ligase [Endomicrobiales bacterium]
MKLSKILKNIDSKVKGDADIEIKGITYDSRKVKRGYAFIALSGQHVDGRSFAAKAVSEGAVCVIADAEIPGIKAVQVEVKNPAEAMADISSNFYSHPDKNLHLIGVTGTNGKTTITYMLESIFSRNKKATGVIGTINYRYAKKVIPALNTTPQSLDVDRMLAEMSREKVAVCVMEVSSHALELDRVRGLEFDTAIFTNLTRDHLDFHRTMEDYFSAKAKLFTSLKSGEKNFPKTAIVNIDDPWSNKLIPLVKGAGVVTYGLSPKADYCAENIRASSRGSEFLVQTPLGRRKVELPHLGRHNVYNALACVASAVGFGVPFESTISALENVQQVPGRLEKVDCGQNYTVVVDYAHTDDALRNVLEALKELNPARLVTVFGCGGDRDRSKRPVMGDVATDLSDFVFVTSDNPRTEDPERIALDIEVGIRRKHRSNYQVLVEREQAIAAAVNMAAKGDIILIAGKGHETYQIIGDQRVHFNDVEMARKYISAAENSRRACAVSEGK